MPEGVTILTEVDHPIATVVETKAQISEEADETAAEDEEGAEGEAAETVDGEVANQETPKE